MPDGKHTSNYWCFVYHIEHGIDYCSVLDELMWCESPLHHGDSEDTKPHIHIMIKFRRKVSFSVAVEYALKCGENAYLIAPVDEANMLRYFVHLTEKSADKEQFDMGINALIPHNGFPLDRILEIDKRDNTDTFKFMLSVIHNEHISEISELYQYLILHLPEYLSFAKKNHRLFKDYIDSYRYSVRVSSINRDYADMLQDEYLSSINK